MPYYVGEDMPEWGDYMAREESGGGEPPAVLFKYVEPLQSHAAVVAFPDTPGPEPVIPPRPKYSPDTWYDSYTKEQQAMAAHALWKISGLTAACRALGVKRVFGSYDGGGDESFTHFHGFEMRDSRAVTEETLRKVAEDIDGGELVDHAVTALMGSYGAGEFRLYGAVIIDFDACTITDEQDAGVVLGDKTAWRL
jgi:hypothetical protein